MTFSVNRGSIYLYILYNNIIFRVRYRFECQTKTLTNYNFECQTQGSNVRHTGSNVRLTLNLSLTFEPCQADIPPLLFQVRM